MNRLLFWLALLLGSFGSLHHVFAQSLNCNDAYLSPFCDGIAQYPANFDNSGAGGGPQAPNGPNYDCLGTQGNPSYFSLSINRSGTIDFTLDNTANADIDFILWGPFSGTNAARLACDSMGNGGIWGGVTDCSYSAVSQEQVSIPNAQAGEVYILMVTNFANVATNIFSTSNTGTGSVACACAIDYTMDTLPAAAGNQGFLVDTSNNINRYVVCPNNSLGFALGSRANNPNDTLGIFGPFTTIGDAFSNFTIAPINPGAPTRYDSLLIIGLLTPDLSHIGVNDFTIGLRNDIFTGGFSDSTCFDFASVEVIVPGVRVQDRNVCPGEQFQIRVDSIPTTSLGSSAYNWRQVSGIPVTFSSSTAQNPTVSIPPASSSSANDSIVLVVDYTYGGLCPMSDTMILRFSNLSLAITATPDTICAGDTSRLDAVFSGILTQPVCDDYIVTAIPFAPLPGTGTLVTNFTFSSDDGISAALPIGFPFEFFCNTYTQFVMSTNGFISFDLSSPDGCCSGDVIPSNTGFDPNNLIALAWEDLNVTGSALEYFTVGTAPNRILVVNYNNINHFGGSNPVTAQLLLYETTNIIEIHTTSQPDAFGDHTQGIENANGTIAFTSPGRNGQPWTATNDAYRFAPRNNGPFFTWTPAVGLDDPSLQNPIATPPATTSYAVAATDNRCVYVDTATLTVISSYPTPMVTCGTATDTTLDVSWSDISLPGTGFYEYSIDGGATWVNVGASFSTTIINLVPGTTYTILVRGNDGSGGACTLSPSGNTACTTTQSNCTGFPDLSASLTATDILCHGDSTACITSTVMGGTGNPVNFFWSTGQLDTSQICNLPAGNYSLTITDTIPGVGMPVVTIAYQEAFDALAAPTWNLNVPTGTNGADNNFWVVNSNEAGNPVGACGTAGGPNQTLHITSAIFPLGGAAYDAGGLCPLLTCPETNMRAESPTFSTVGLNNLTFEFNYIANGAGLQDNASVLYNDGTGWQVLTNSIKSNVCASGQGEWAKFSAPLPPSCNNNPNVQVGINWTNNDDGNGTDPSVAIDSVLVFANQTGGGLFVCRDTQNIIITQPTPLMVQVDTTIDNSCSGVADGLVAVATTGGTPTYTYQWDVGPTTDTIRNLADGTYSVTVTDLNGCTDSVQAIVNPASPLVVTIANVTNNGCPGQPNGSITTTVIGGTPPVTYLWSNNAVTANLINVPDGTYGVTVSDGNGCSASAQATISPTLALSLTQTVTGPNCAGDSAVVTIGATGGSGNYSYDWGSASGSTTNTATLGAGNYVVTVNDINNGCVQTDTLTITAPSALVVNLVNQVNIPCGSTLDTGSIDMDVTGGTPTYTYNWDNGAATQDLTGLPAGNYALTVTDANGCTATAGPYTITSGAGVTVAIANANPTLACDQAPIGSLTAQASGGTGLSYQWNTGGTDSTLTGLAAGTYTVVVTNADGCADSATATIVAPLVPTLAAYVQAPGTRADTVALNTAVPIGAGSTGFSYQWTATADPNTGDPAIANPNAGTTTATPDPAGTYTYMVTASATTNDTTCTVMDTVFIVVQPDFLGIPDAFTPNGDGTNDLFRPVYLSEGEVMEFRVFNRWGQEVYNGTQNNFEGWDGIYQGVPQPTEVYIYFISYQRASEPEGRMIKGEMTLIR